MTKKETALSFLWLVTSGKIREAYEKHVDLRFRHHNPYFKGDAKSLMTGMEENESKFPNKVLDIKRAVAEGDLVAVHSHVTLKPGEIEMAVAHVFRFEGDRIAELWDVGQPIPKDIRKRIWNVLTRSCAILCRRAQAL